MTTGTMFPGAVSPRRLLAAIVIAACSWAGATAASQPSRAEIAGKSRALSVPFIANEGQADERVAFYARTFGGTVFVTRAGEIVYALPAAKAGDDDAARGLALRERLVGRKPATVRGEGQTVTHVSEFQGRDRSRWRSGLPTHHAVSLGEVYEGIELRLKARGGSVEKIFRVKPGAEPAAIGLRIDGARGLRVNERGQLEAATALGTVTFTKPVAFQEIEGRRVDVPVRYALRARGAYGFEVGAYDAGQPLVIDPLLASMFVGGGGWDRAYAIALERVVLDRYPAVFIAGWTTSKRLPVAWGEMYDAKRSGPEDAFVAKLDADLTTLLAATFLGGSGIEEAWGLSLDLAGNVYVAGWTSSRNFPTTPDAARRTHRGGLTDAFVSKLDNGLQNLLASTFLGGEGEDRARGLVVVRPDVNAEGVYVTGYTQSRNFPNTVRPCCAEHEWVRGGTDAFVTLLNSDLGSIVHSAVLGGRGDDRAYAIAAGGSDPSFYPGSPMIVITGCAGRWGHGNATPDSHYPVTEHAYDRTPSNDGQDAFVTVLSWDLARLFGSTFLGGADGGSSVPEGTCGRAVAIDYDDYNNVNNVFVAGVTFSNDFLPSPGAYDETYNDNQHGQQGVCGTHYDDRPRGGERGDVFVAKLSSIPGAVLDPLLGTLAASTFLGGCAADRATGLALDASGNVFVTGYTYSPDFPTTVLSYYPTHSGRADGFVSKLDGNLTELPASTFLGGSDFDAAVGLALDASGNIYVAGYTYSADFPTTIPLAEINGPDAFVSKLNPILGEFGID